MLNRRPLQRFVPSFDALEARLALDGNVSLALRHGILVVLGDFENNQISIAGNGAGNVTVSSLDGVTTLNQLPDPISFTGVHGLSINLGDGDDVLEMLSISLRKELSVNAGAGLDSITIDNSLVSKNAAISTLGGDDIVSVLNSSFSRDLAFSTGADFDQIALTNTRIKGDLKVLMGDGDDSFTSDNVLISDEVSIATQRGNDVVTVLDSSFKGETNIHTSFDDDQVNLTTSFFHRGLFINTYSGNDTVLVDGVFSTRDSLINLNSGDDSITVLNSHFARRFDLQAGSGDDQVALAFSFFGKKSVVDGQTGLDTLIFQDNQWGANARVKGFDDIIEGLLPIAADDSASASTGGSVLIDLAANDSTFLGTLDLTSIAIVSGPSNGSLVLNGDGTVTYTHDGSATTTDSFQYTIMNDLGDVSGVATVSIQITTPPQANDDTGTLNEGASASFNIALNDQAALGQTLDLNSIVITSFPTNGSVVLNGDGSVTYTHNGSETLSDTFQYTISDDVGSVSNVAVVNLTITPQNDSPIAANDSFTLAQGASLVLSILANDTDAETTLNVSTVMITQQPSNGSVMVNADGTVTYQHNNSLTVSDTFRYTVQDSTGLISNAGFVFLTINLV